MTTPSAAALEGLKAALALGLAPAMARNDPDLAELRATPEFDALLAKFPKR